MFGRSSKDLSCGAYSLESKERDRGQGKRESWKVEVCRREEEEEIVRISPTTLGQGASRGCQEIPDYKI